MSRAHRAHLDRLLALARGILDDFLHGRPPDLDAFDQARDAELAALEALGDLDPDDPTIEDCRARLTELARVNDVLLTHFARLRDETRGRLMKLDRGRRGLQGYQKALPPAPKHGGRHGRG
ncbi:MAG: hypothetical protein H6704_30705 [Myxococcales bacterium]|nr:hypothetical protein [Myxococcales bacterium]